MNKLLANKYYRVIIFILVLAPNLFAAFGGIESFPFTAAPMFAHHINKNSEFYVFKFEGVTLENDTIDLKGFYGKKERDFMRHFFGRAYGVSSGINPFSSKLGIDSNDKFETRMNLFFLNFHAFIKKQYQLSFHKIILSVKKVDSYRNDLSSFEIIGYYTTDINTYSYGPEIIK